METAVLTIPADYPSYLRSPVRLAIRAAQRSDVRFRMGAVVFSRNRIISFGVNKGKTHPNGILKQLRAIAYPTIHAELDALLGVDIDEFLNVASVDIIVVRLTKSGMFATSRPCHGCLQLLQRYNIRNMYYIDKNRQLTRERCRL